VEKLARQNPNLDSVLVSVESAAALQRAYTNYFLDTRQFVEVMQQTLRSTRLPKKQGRQKQPPLIVATDENNQ
jgi:hypothetical protein